MHTLSESYTGILHNTMYVHVMTVVRRAYDARADRSLVTRPVRYTVTQHAVIVRATQGESKQVGCNVKCMHGSNPGDPIKRSCTATEICGGASETKRAVRTEISMQFQKGKGTSPLLVRARSRPHTVHEWDDEHLAGGSVQHESRWMPAACAAPKRRAASASAPRALFTGWHGVCILRWENCIGSDRLDGASFMVIRRRRRELRR